MSSDVSPEIGLLRDSMSRCLGATPVVEQLRGLRHIDAGKASPQWDLLSQHGWLGAAVPEPFGGSGMGFDALVAIALEFGRHFCAEAWLPHMSAGLALARWGTEAQKHRWLPLLATGEVSACLVAGGSWQLTDESGDLRLSGCSESLPGGAAELLVILAPVANATAPAAWTVVLVERGAPGCQAHGYRLLDGTSAADLLIRHSAVVPAQVMPLVDDVERDWLLDVQAVLQCHEIVGAMASTLASTLDYLKQRVQFGHPLGSNQALQHRMVDLFVLHQESDALAREATRYLSASFGAPAAESVERKLAVSAAKLHMHEAARRMGHEAIQMHGGIGTTDECIVSHAFKKLTSARLLYGETATHQQRMARLMAQVIAQEDTAQEESAS